MFNSRNRRDHAKRRTLRPALGLERLEDRTLLSAAPATTVIDLKGLSVNPTQYSSTDILVRFQETPGTPGGPAVVAGTTLASQLPLATGFYEVNLAKGTTVAQALAAYKAEAGVLDAEPDYEVTVSSVPNDPLLSQQWNLHNTGQNGGTPGADIHAEQAWNVTTGSHSIVVGVMDTGIDYDSPDLYQNIWLNQAEIPLSRLKNLVDVYHDGYISWRDLNSPVNIGTGKITDVNRDGRIDAGDILAPMILNAQRQDTGQGGWSFAGNTRDGDTAHPNDYIGWNFVTNTNNPYDDNGHGTHVSGILGAMGNNATGVSGIDWNASIMPVKFISSNGEGTVSAFIQGLNYSVQHGAKITNNSWEGAPYSQALFDAVNNARAHGQIFVAAAGNEGANDDITSDYPASLSRSLNNVVAVAATDSSDRLASFSNYGPTSVALAAPGVNILSTLPSGRYGAMSGTSMATPEVTGALALVWGLHPSWTYTQVINQVLNTTDKLPSLQGKVVSGGRLDVAAAVGWNLSTRITPAITNVAIQGPTPGTMNSLLLTFNEPIDVSSVTAENVRLTNTTGQLIPVTVRVINNSGDRQIILLFSNQTVSGNYHLSINSTVHDMMGNAMNPYQTTVTLTAAQTYTNSTASAIKPWTTTAFTLTVPQATTIGSLQVKLNATYPVDGELYAYLISPTGKAVALIDHRGGTGANFQNTIFSDAASSTIASGNAPFAGTYRPESALSQLNGSNAGGVWRLMVQDKGGHSGTLLNWSLTITPTGGSTSNSPPASPPPAPPAAGPKTFTTSTASVIKAATTTTSTLTVPPGTTVGSLQVKLNATYPVDGELYAYLVTPTGKAVALVDHRGGTGANFQNTIFSDAAGSTIASGKAPFSGTYRPETALSNLKGINAAGVWRLMIQDKGGHSGTLANWSLIITPPGGSTSSVEVSSTESESSLVSPSAPVNDSSPAVTSASPRISAAEDNIAAMFTALLSGQNKGTLTPPTPADSVFASPTDMAQLWTNLLVGKRPSDDSPNYYPGI